MWLLTVLSTESRWYRKVYVTLSRRVSVTPRSLSLGSSIYLKQTICRNLTVHHHVGTAPYRLLAFFPPFQTTVSKTGGVPVHIDAIRTGFTVRGLAVNITHLQTRRWQARARRSAAQHASHGVVCDEAPVAKMKWFHRQNGRDGLIRNIQKPEGQTLRLSVKTDQDLVQAHRRQGNRETGEQRKCRERGSHQSCCLLQFQDNPSPTWN